MNTATAQDPQQCGYCLNVFPWAQLARPGVCVECDDALARAPAAAVAEHESAVQGHTTRPTRGH